MEAQVWDILNLNSMHCTFKIDNVLGDMAVGVKVENVLEMIPGNMER